jgi:ribulose-5-phosphate 4-epimerase/fuculose-1-phosphate aldolase
VYIQCRISQEFEHFLVAPHGLLYSEVTAASLVRVDRQADILHAGTTTLGINQVAFKLHGALHASRPDLKCLIHLRNPTAISVSRPPKLYILEVSYMTAIVTSALLNYAALSLSSSVIYGVSYIH